MSEKSIIPASLTQKQNQYIANQRRQSLEVLNNRTRNSRLSSILPDTLNEFFQATQNMEDEILLPTRLKDMNIDELIFDNSNQPDNWHEIYTFVRNIRDQLQCTYPFANDNVSQEDAPSNLKQRKYSNDDDGIIVSGMSSSTSSVVSSEDYEQNSAASSIPGSFETIKDELKYHYYGLFQSLNNLTLMANRVKDKYREETNL
ncbi:hypothetical protein I4U23_000835 [Adineta vaga]|nr:hypothetical protein I4U23_000835 [Adineta vaga]